MKLELGLLACIQSAVVGFAAWVFRDMLKRVEKIERSYVTEDQVRRQIELELRSIRVTNEDIKEDIREIKQDVKEMLKAQK